MDGFSVEGDIARPLADIEQGKREQLIRVLAAVNTCATPEDTTRWLAEGFPATIEQQYLDLPLVREELSDFVDVVLSVLQAGRVAA